MPSDARILVVDDEPKICHMLEAALRPAGYAVESCLDGASALERFRAQPHDLVISDLRMPGLGGFELIRQIKEAHPHTMVVAITGHATVETAVQALSNGADDYVTKPLDIAALRRVVGAALQNRDLLAASPSPPPQPQEATSAAASDLLEANRQLEQRVGELLAIQEVSLALSGELQLDRLLDAGLGSVAEATGARTVTVLLADPAQESLVVRARRSRDRQQVVGERRAYGAGIAGWVAEHRVPLLIPDVDDQPAFRELARREGYESASFVAVPLLAGERLVGVLCATEKGDEQPFDERDLRMVLAIAAQMAVAIENARAYEALQSSAFAALRSLAEVAEVREGYTRGHGERVASYAARAAGELGLSGQEIDTLRRAATIHDIGRTAISDSVLGRPGPLSDEERATVREHPVRGERIVGSLGFFDATRPLVRHHHERWDGQGYPDGLKGREIDPLTRILSLADAFDAMTSSRPQRGPKSRQEALAELAACAGTQFDPGLVDAFSRGVEGLA
ncbi:MAG: HD domain-containing phosphohydrolase [Candidatus Brocadiia bacterium]